MIKGKWSQQRQLIRTQSTGLIEKTIIDAMKDQTEDHLRFMLKQISEERAEIVARKKMGNIKDQRERLEVLAELDKTARRTLGLDEQNIADKKTMSVNAMISLHMAPPKANEEVEIVTGKHIMEGEVEEVEDVVAIVSDNDEDEGTLPG
jgi:transcription elongation GreA/GreB family factor